MVPYLTLMTQDAPQREHDLREVFNGMRWIVRTGSPWRYMPNDLPPWETVYQQSRRWLAAGVFEAMTQDLRRVLRSLEGRHEEPSAAIFDSRTLQSTPESGKRAGYDGAKRRKARKCTLQWSPRRRRFVVVPRLDRQITSCRYAGCDAGPPNCGGG